MLKTFIYCTCLKIHQRGKTSLVVRTPSEVKGMSKSSHSSLGKWARVKRKQQHLQIQWDLLGMFELREESEKYHCEDSGGVYTMTVLGTRLRCHCISCCLDLASPKLIVLVWVCWLWGFFFFSLYFHGFYANFWFTTFEESVFSTQLHELPHLQSPEKKEVGGFGSMKYHGCGRKEETWESQKAGVLHKFMISWASNITRRGEVKFYKGTPIV